MPKRNLKRSSRTCLRSSSFSANFHLSFDFRLYVSAIAPSPSLSLTFSSKWGYLMPDFSCGRIIDIFLTKKKNRKGKAVSLVFSTTAEYPVVFHVCNESKAEAQKFFSKYCALDIGTSEPVYFNPATDAIFLRYLNTEDMIFPRLDKVRHSIIHTGIEPRYLAQHCPHLEDLTIVHHGFGQACRSLDMTKKFPLKLYKPSGRVCCEYNFRSYNDAMDLFKLANPNWKKPVLNILSATIEGERCCWLDNWTNPAHPKPRPVQLQNSAFWEEHCVPEP